MRHYAGIALILALPVLAVAQGRGERPVRPTVRASGDATVTVKPDQAKLYIGVVTQARTAAEAAAQNASRTTALLQQLKQAIGQEGEIKTTNYSVNPNYVYPHNGGQRAITGYSANNTVLVTVNNLSNIGKVIDTATQNGANEVNSIQFTLRDEQKARSEALAAAAVKAKAKAEAMAAALGLKVEGVLSAESGESVQPRFAPMPMMARAEASSTPVETGTLDVHATVTVILLVQ